MLLSKQHCCSGKYCNPCLGPAPEAHAIRIPIGATAGGAGIGGWAGAGSRPQRHCRSRSKSERQCPPRGMSVARIWRSSDGVPPWSTRAEGRIGTEPRINAAAPPFRAGGERGRYPAPALGASTCPEASPMGGPQGKQRMTIALQRPRACSSRASQVMHWLPCRPPCPDQDESGGERREAEGGPSTGREQQLISTTSSVQPTGHAGWTTA